MDELIRFDQQLLLALNGSDSVWLDQVMLYVTLTSTWIPLFVALLLMLLRLRLWREVLMVVVCLALVVLLCDQFASSLCKPLFQRYRPSHEPALLGMVDLVNGRRGGLYGFISSHAANTFGVFMFTTLYLRRTLTSRWLLILSSVTVFLWACLSSYSRIYLGLHYPGDIFFGILAGLFFGWFIYRLFTSASRFLYQPRTLPVLGLRELSPLLLPITFLLTLLSISLL